MLSDTANSLMISVYGEQDLTESGLSKSAKELVPLLLMGHLLSMHDHLELLQRPLTNMHSTDVIMLAKDLEFSIYKTDIVIRKEQEANAKAD